MYGSQHCYWECSICLIADNLPGRRQVLFSTESFWICQQLTTLSQLGVQPVACLCIPHSLASFFIRCFYQGLPLGKAASSSKKNTKRRFYLIRTVEHLKPWFYLLISNISDTKLFHLGFMWSKCFIVVKVTVSICKTLGRRWEYTLSPSQGKWSCVSCYYRNEPL